MSESPELAVITEDPAERPRAVSAGARDDLAEQLGGTHKRLPARLEDARSIDLLERWYARDSFYPRVREAALVREHAAAVAIHAGPACAVIEPWQGNPDRTLALLGTLDRPVVYLPIAADAMVLQRITMMVRARRGLDVRPASELPRLADVKPHGIRRTVIFLPGSQLARLEPTDAVRLLQALGKVAGPHAALVLSADSTSDPAALQAAYDVPEAEAWARHLLARSGDVALDAFRYDVHWNAALTRLELRFVSLRDQILSIGGTALHLHGGEPLVVEHRYQHTFEALSAMLAIAGWWPRHVLTSSPEPVRLWLCEQIPKRRSSLDSMPVRTRRWRQR